MAVLRDRFPSARDTSHVYATCAVPIYSWSILVFLGRARGWLYHMPAWDVAGILAYCLVFAALESGAVLLVPLLLSLLLPKTIMRDKFVARGSAVAVLGLGGAAFVQANLAAPWIRLAQRHPVAWAVGLPMLSFALLVAVVSVWLFERAGKVAAAVVERLALLMTVYMLATLVSVVILVIRNI